MTLAEQLDHLRIYTHPRLDRRALLLICLFAIVIAGALAAQPTAVDGGAESAVSDSSTGEQAAGGAVWVLAEVAFAVGLLLALVAWRRIPTWIRDALEDVLRVGFWLLLGAWAVLIDSSWLFFGSVGLYAAAKLLDGVDTWWIANDLLAIALAIYGAVILGIVLGPVVLAVGLLGLTVYDHVFANRRAWMFDLASWMIRRRLPMLFVVPASWRLDWDDLSAAATAEPAAEADGGEPPADVEELIGFGIGTADLLLPAAFVVALDAGGAHWLPVTGASLGVLLACLLLSGAMNDVDRGGAGLPPLTAGALGGWALAWLPVVMLGW